MQSVLTMAAANIRKRKAQSILILVIILMASLLLATAIGILGNLSNPFENMFAAQNASHLTLQVSEHTLDLDQAVQWWQSRGDVEAVQTFPFYWMEDQVAHNGRLQSMGSLIMAQHPGTVLTQDKLTVVEGEEKTAPGANELWVPTGYAYAWGIRPGDTLEINIAGEKTEFTVSAIIVDPQYSMSMMNPIRVWTGWEFPADHLSDVLISIRFSDYTSYPQLWEEFQEYLGHPVPGFSLDYTALEYAYSQIEGIIGAIMLLFSVIIILVALTAIAFTIANGVVLDYKVIGTLGAQGFSPGNIRWIYTLQYLVLAALGIPAGILLSQPVVSGVMSQMLKTQGIASLDASLMAPAILTSGVMIMAVLVAAYTSSGKAGKVKPAEAIRHAAPPAKSGAKRRMDITSFKGLSISLLMGLKNTVTGRRNSLFLAAAAAVMAFVLVFSVNTYTSVRDMDQNYAYWGFDASHVFISRPDVPAVDGHHEVIDPLLADPRTKAVVPTGVLLASISAQSGQPSSNVVGFVYAGDMDSIGILNLEGRSPIHSNEVSLSALSAKEFGKTVGDMVELFIEGETVSFLVTGIYQSINGMGRGFRIQESAVRKINPDSRMPNYSILLHDSEDSAQFVRDMKDLFPETYNIRTAAESGEINLSGITAYMALIALNLSIIFMGVAFVIIFSLTLINIYSEKKNYGIYKALGMTPLQIRMSIVWKAGFLALIGASIGIPLSLFLTPQALSMLVAEMGLMKFPFAPTAWGTAAALPVSILVAVFSAWIPSGRILGLNPRNLIID